MKLLFLQQDYASPDQAKHWSYWNHLGFSHALRRYNFEVDVCLIPHWKMLKDQFLVRNYDCVLLNDVAHGLGKGRDRISYEDISELRARFHSVIGLSAESVNGYKQLDGTPLPLTKVRASHISECLNLFNGLILPDKSELQHPGFDGLKTAHLHPFMPLELHAGIFTPDTKVETFLFIGSLNEHRRNFLSSISRDSLAIGQIKDEVEKFWQPYCSALVSKNICQMSFAGYQQFVEDMRQIRKRAYAHYLNVVSRFAGLAHIPTYFEGLHPRLMEAAVVGRVPLLPFSADLMEVGCVDGYNCLLFDSENPASLQDKIEYAKGRLNDLQLMGERARVMSRERFSEHIHLSRLAKFICDCIPTSSGLQSQKFKTEFNVNINKALSANDLYKLPLLYNSASEPEYFHDINQSSGVIWQPDIYDFASDLCKMTGANRLVDLGCGKAEKLISISDGTKIQTLGIDHGSNLEHCRKEYPNFEWQSMDLESPEELGSYLQAGDGLVMSDVIEHLKCPERILNVFKSQLSKLKFILLSTPDRRLVRGFDDNGPPRNRAHIREWSLVEFIQFLASRGLSVKISGYTRDNTVRNKYTTSFCLISNERVFSCYETHILYYIKQKADCTYLSISQ